MCRNAGRSPLDTSRSLRACVSVPYTFQLHYDMSPLVSLCPPRVKVFVCMRTHMTRCWRDGGCNGDALPSCRRYRYATSFTSNAGHRHRPRLILNQVDLTHGHSLSSTSCTSSERRTLRAPQSVPRLPRLETHPPRIGPSRDLSVENQIKKVVRGVEGARERGSWQEEVHPFSQR